MSEVSDKKRASELAQELEEEPSRLTESHDGEGTTNQPVIEYINTEEEIRYIFTAIRKSIAINDKGSGENLYNDGEPTYVFTNKRVLGIMPKENDDETYEISYSSITDVENNFGWTKWRMEIKADNDNYHLWISQNTDRENFNDAKDYILKQRTSQDQESEDRNSTNVSVSTSSSIENSDPSGIEIGVSIHPNSALQTMSGFPDVSSKITKGKNTEHHKKIIADDYSEYTREYTSKKQASIYDDGIKIGTDRIKFSDILNAKFRQNRDLLASSTSSSVLHDCDYIALTVAKDGTPTDEPPTAFNGDVFYIYLIGAPEEWQRHDPSYQTVRDECHIVNTPSASRKEIKELYENIRDNLPEELLKAYILQDYIERPSYLKVEGWKESGVTDINAGVDGSINSTGRSRGVQVGPFTSSKSESQGTIAANLEGSIDDTSFTSEIDFLQISDNGIFVDSDPVLDFDYDAVDRVLKRDMGFTLEAGDTAYTIGGPADLVSLTLGNGDFSPHSSLRSPNVKDAIEFMREQIKKVEKSQGQSTQHGGNISEKLRELKDLHEDGILTDEEFRSKKEDLLDDF